jgi:hypothetical protein
MSTFSNSIPFAYSPSPFDYRYQRGISPVQVMQQSNNFNVPFSTSGFNNAKMCCSQRLPTWPVQRSSRLYPVIDRTVDLFPVYNSYWEDGINAYRDVLTNQVSQTGTWTPGPAEIMQRQRTNF